MSNGVPLFRKPTIPNAQRALTAIIALLALLLAGIAYLTACVRHRRDRSGTARLPERDLDARRRRDGPRGVLLPDHRIGGRRARAFGEHELRGLSASVSCPGRGPVPPRFVRDSRPPPRVLAGHHCPRRAVRACCWSRSAALPIGSSRSSRSGALVAFTMSQAGMVGALATRGRPPGAPLAPDQPRWRGRDRDHGGRRRDCQVLRRVPGSSS